VVPQRSLVIALFVLGLTSGVHADVAKSAAPASVETPIEGRAYKIRAYVSFDPATQISGHARDRVIDAWRSLAVRFVGPAWDLQRADTDGPAAASDLSTLTPDAIRPLAEGSDKVWLIQGRLEEGKLILAGREFDAATGFLGSIHTRPVPFRSDLPRELFRLSESLFAPFAEIGEPVGDVVPLRVQGSALPRGSEADPIAPVGSIFRPLRVYYKEDGSVLNIEKILYSYLRVETREGALTKSTLIRGVRDPLTKRISRKNRLMALGIQACPSPTRLHFVKLSDRSPAAGYVLAFRPVPQGPFRDIATTDREGRVSIPPGFSPGLVVFRLLAGKAEPMLDLPVMPGETDEELTIVFEPKPHAIALQTQLDALRDAIVDIVAVRSRLERRMKAREEGDDWAGVEEAVVEFRKLTPREVFIKRLDTLKEDAEKLEAKSRSIVLTKNARAQLTDTRSLIDRYLDDSLIRGYEEAVQVAKARAASGAAAKAKAAAAVHKSAPAVPQPKPVTTNPASIPARPAGPTPSAPVPF
jgi:hypothetical protein